MTRLPWSPEIHHFLDGDATPIEEAARAEAERYRALLAAYRGQLRLPGAEIDSAVLERVARQRRRGGSSRLRWLLQPRALRVSPLLAAAVLGALIVGTSAVQRALGGRAGAPVAATRASAVLVRFELQAPNAARVALAGSFNGWSDSTRLRLNASTGRWSVTVPLEPGEYEYLFVIDGRQWVPDPGAHAQVSDGLGSVNSLLVVGPRGVVRS